MNKIRKILIITFATFLSIVFLLAVSFFTSPFITTRVFKYVSKDIEYVPSDYNSFQELNYIVQKDISYESKYKNGYLDVYSPQGNTEIRPTILWVHGGSYVSGDKSDLNTFLPYFTKEDYIVISINYELAPTVKFPTPIKQIKEAYEFIYYNASLYNIDLNNFFIGGDSVGAEMVSQFVNVQESLEYSNLLNIEQSDVAVDIKGVILYFGTFRIDGLSDIKQLSKIFFDHMKWTYLGKRRWSESSLASAEELLTHIDTYPKTYITDVTKEGYAQRGRKLSDVLTDRVHYFPKKADGGYLPFQYQYYLEGTKQDREVAVYAQQNFQNTINFMKAIIVK